MHSRCQNCGKEWDYRKKWANKTEAQQDPIEHVYVFVKTTDDRRYKDEWKYYEGESEDEIREREGLPRSSSDEKFVYHCLGNIAKLPETADQYSFDLKENWSGIIPVHLMWMTEKNELEELRERASTSEQNA